MELEFRIARPDDALGILSIYAPFCESSPVSFEVVSPSEQEMQSRIRQIGKQYPWLIGIVDGEVAGYVYASQHRERAAYRWAVDVAVYIAATHRRCGLGTLLYQRLFTVLCLQGYFKAYASITLPNESSVALHESLGFRRVGQFTGNGYKLGRWWDVGWWQLALQPEIADPPEPVQFDQIRDDSLIIAALSATGLAEQ